jgi:hypothetical protein
MSTLIADRRFTNALVRRAARTALNSEVRTSRRAFHALVWSVHARSDLLRPTESTARDEAVLLNRLVGGLRALHEHRDDWIRPVEQWEPHGSDPASLFSSLAHHLLANYRVPPVLESAWFQGLDRRARRQQDWYKHAALGQSLRTAGFPIKLSRRMAHEFAHASESFPIGFALRWAQVRGLGGTDALARAVAATGIGALRGDHAFWTSAIHFLINHPALDLALVGDVIDYLIDQRFARRPVIIGEDTEIFIDPPQPNLSLKGWTVQSLLRRLDEWKARRDEPPERRRMQWNRSAIGEYHRHHEESQAWTIRELLDSDALAAEGKAMGHCVAEYTESCAKGESTIWSLGIEGRGDRQRVLTIEVDPKTRDLVEAKMKFNEDPDERCRSVVEDWARQEGLKVAW